MGADEGDIRRREPLSPLQPKRPSEKRWPSPTPGLPVQKKKERDRKLDQILDKLEDIQRKLERIEKLLSKRPV